MTFDTFDSYNTDEAYKDKGTTAKGLVDAYKKDNPNGSADDFYAKLNKTWAQDKDGHVKNAVNEAFKTKEEVKEEPKAEEKTAPKVEEMTQATEALEQPKAEKKKSNLDDETKSYMDVNSEIANTAEDEEYDRQAESLGKRWDARLANIDKMSDSMSRIDDHLIDQLPTFMWRRYQNGEFGDISDTSTPEGRASKRNAQLRLAYFAMNNVVSKLKKLYNADSIVRGQGPIFNDTESAYDKYQQTNLEQGLQNRWDKYKQETQSAIDLAKQGGMSEESITDSIATISANNRLQSKFNMMNERQKVFALKVLGEVGDKLGNMNDAQFANTLMGMSAMGESLDPKEAAGMLIYRFVKDPEKRKAALSELGLVSGGIGGGLGGLLGGNKGESSEGEESATGVKLSDGTIIDVGKMMSLNDFSGIKKAANDLSDRYYRGEISAEQFRDDYSKLYNVVQSHNIMNKLTGTLKPVDKRVKELDGERVGYWDRQIEDLNNQAKNGLIKPSDYNEKFAELEKSLVNAGGDAKKTAKKKMSTEAIIKANEKIDKEKKKRK
jgi:hypothetical protein